MIMGGPRLNYVVARCVWCKKPIRIGKTIKREVSSERGQDLKVRKFHKKCWPEFVVSAFMDVG